MGDSGGYIGWNAQVLQHEVGVACGYKVLARKMQHERTSFKEMKKGARQWRWLGVTSNSCEDGLKDANVDVSGQL